jgi:hypothetical protein
MGGGGLPLSYVGEPFDYDVFVSYAHAEVETKAPLIRDWSRHVAGRLRALLATALNVEGGSLESEIQVFFDDRCLFQDSRSRRPCARRLSARRSSSC